MGSEEFCNGLILTTSHKVRILVLVVAFYIGQINLKTKKIKKITCQILTLGVYPVVTGATLHHLTVIVVVLVALEADWTVVTFGKREKQAFTDN